MRQVCDRPRGIRWTLLKHLEDLDFNDIALLVRLARDLQIKTTQLEHIAKKTGLRININKTKTMHIPEPPTEKIKIEEQEIEIEPADNFTYLGSVISPTNGAEKDIKSRLSKA